MLKIMIIICFIAIAFIFLFMAYLLDNEDKWYINADGQIKFSKKRVDNKSHRWYNKEKLRKGTDKVSKAKKLWRKLIREKNIM